MTAPSHAPGLSWAGTQDAQPSRMQSARYKNLVMSIPVSAAGTSPKYDSTEYRPPISGRRGILSREFSIYEMSGLMRVYPLQRLWTGDLSNISRVTRYPPDRLGGAYSAGQPT
jgi:hypothetical protein